MAEPFGRVIDSAPEPPLLSAYFATGRSIRDTLIFPRPPHHIPKLRVAGSNPVSRSSRFSNDL
jgi:hypothetical protein